MTLTLTLCPTEYEEQDGERHDDGGQGAVREADSEHDEEVCSQGGRLESEHAGGGRCMAQHGQLGVVLLGSGIVILEGELTSTYSTSRTCPAGLSIRVRVARRASG